MKPAIHKSMLTALCPMQVKLRYVDGLKRRPGVAMLTGTATHAGVALNLRRKKDTGSLAPIEEAQTHAVEKLREEWSKDTPELDDDEREQGMERVYGAAVDEAVGLVALHATEIAPLRTPKEVEFPMRVNLEGFPFDVEGTADLIDDLAPWDGTEALRDLKSVSKSPSADAAEKSLDLAMYAWMRETITGKKLSRVGLDVLVKTTKPKALMLGADAPPDHSGIIRRVEALAHVFETGAFMPIDPGGPMGWCCSKRWCGFWESDCPFGKRARVSVSMSVNPGEIK